MDIELYHQYKLKDGRTGFIVEIFGDGKDFLFELDKKTPEEWLIDVTRDDIAEKIK